MNEETNSEYYLFVEKGTNPELEYRNPDYLLSRYLNLCKPITLPDDYDEIDLYVRGKSKKPKMVDYLTIFSFEHVVTERLKQAIEEMNPININYLPTIIHANNGDHQNYFIVNCYNLIPAMDKKQSVWTKSHNTMPGREVLSIDKMVIDMDKLKDIPLPERLIFSLNECRTYTLFHESVVDHIEKLKPTGFHAVPVDAWDADLCMIL